MFRRLTACSHLYNADAIVQDKTGTLTQNKMHVVNVAVDDMVFDSSAYGAVLPDSTPEIASNLSQLVAVGGLCNAAVFNADKDSSSETSVVGDATGSIALPIRRALFQQSVSQTLRYCGFRMLSFRPSH